VNQIRNTTQHPSQPHFLVRNQQIREISVNDDDNDATLCKHHAAHTQTHAHTQTQPRARTGGKFFALGKRREWNGGTLYGEGTLPSNTQ